MFLVRENLEEALVHFPFALPDEMSVPEVVQHVLLSAVLLVGILVCLLEHNPSEQWAVWWLRHITAKTFLVQLHQNGWSMVFGCCLDSGHYHHRGKGVELANSMPPEGAQMRQAFQGLIFDSLPMVLLVQAIMIPACVFSVAQ